MSKYTPLERKQRNRIIFLQQVIERLQEALGVEVDMEISPASTRYIKKLNFSIKLGNKLFDEAKHYQALRDAIMDLIKYKVEMFLIGKEGQNGWIEDVDLSEVDPSP